MKKIILGFIALIIVTLGVVLYFSSGSKGSPANIITDKDSASVSPVADEYGVVLAGKSSKYYEFTKAGYGTALTSGKIIFLDFYADWCPICREEAAIIKNGFDNLTSNNVIGFRVNFNDPDTDLDEKNLAKEFNVPYQHTKIFLKDGKEIDRYPNQWSDSDFTLAFQKNLIE